MKILSVLININNHKLFLELCKQFGFGGHFKFENDVTAKAEIDIQDKEDEMFFGSLMGALAVNGFDFVVADEVHAF